MPIKVSCKCGQSFAAKDELAGKAVKCPKCGQPLRIPRPKAPPTAPAPAASSAMSDLFDEVGLGAHVEDNRAMCPGCGEPLQDNAVLCISCGLNLHSGKQVRGVKQKTQAVAGDGHSAAAADLLSKAEKALSERPMDRSGGGKDAWWMPWVTMLALCVAAGLAFLVWMAFSKWINAPVTEGTVAETTTTSRIPFFIFLGMMCLGSILMLASSIMVAVYAFKHEDTPIHGLLAIFVNIYAVIYAAMRMEKLEREVKLWCFGLFCYIAGLTTLMFSAVMAASGGGNVQLSPQQMGAFLLGLIFILMIAAGMTMMWVGWIWSVVLGFMDRWYQGVLALVYPFYGGIYCILRKEEHGVPAKLWLFGLGSIFGAVALMFFISLTVVAGRADIETSKLLIAVGILLARLFVPPIVAVVVNVGLVYAAIGLHNLFFGGSKKDSVAFPSFGSVLGMCMGLTVASYFMGLPTAMGMGAGAMTGNIAGFLVVAFFAFLIIYYPPFVFLIADMCVVKSDSTFKQGIVVGAIYLIEGLILTMIGIGILAAVLGVAKIMMSGGL